MEAIEEKGSIDPTEYLLVLLKNRWLIAVATILCAGLSFFYTLRLQPVYKAEATLIIEQEKMRSPLTGQYMAVGSFFDQTLNFKTHAKLIKSREILDRVVRILELGQEGQVEKRAEEIEVSPFREMLRRYRKNLFLLLGLQRKKPTYEESLKRLKGVLSEKIKIQPIRDTHLMEISVTTHDPVLSRNIANAVAEAYIKFNLENRLKSSENSMSWMSGQLYETKKKLEDAEAEFLAYKQEQDLFSMEGRQSVIATQISDLNRSLLEVQASRQVIENKIRKLSRNLKAADQLDQFSPPEGLPMIQTLYSQFLKAEMDLAQLGKVYRAKHPKMVQARALLSSTRERFLDEVEKAVANLSAERAMLMEKEEELRASVTNIENEAQETNRKELRYAMLQRNVEAAKQLYNTLLSKAEETNVTSDIDVSNIRIVEAAILPEPIWPNRRRIKIMGLIFGLLLGVGLAFLREYVDQSLRTEEDVQKYLGLPVLAVIPLADEQEADAVGGSPPSTVRQNSLEKRTQPKS